LNFKLANQDQTIYLRSYYNFASPLFSLNCSIFDFIQNIRLKLLIN